MATTKGQPKKRQPEEKRTRNWLTILYPESLRDDFRDIIRSWHIPALLSPLHDRDTDKDGKPKKPHYHLITMFKGKKSYSQMTELFGTLVKAGHAEPKECLDMRGSARYLCHMDDAAKFRYAESDVTAFGGIDYQEMIELPTDKERYVREMCAWCRDTGCISFAALVDEAATNHPDWHHALISNCTMIMFRYIRSLEDESKRGGRQYDGAAQRRGEPEAEKAPKDPAPDPDVSPLDIARAKVRQAEIDLLAAQERLKAGETKE